MEHPRPEALPSLTTQTPGREVDRGDADRTSHHRSQRRQIGAAVLLVLATAIGGVCLAHGNQPSVVDTWFPSFLSSGHHSVVTDVTWLRYPQVIVVGAVIIACIALPRDRITALACLVGPPLALLTSELVLKPMVGRTLGAGLSYPSGSTVGAAALGTALALAVPPRVRTAAIVAASVYALWMALAVVSLQWHYPTDAMAGLSYGVGVVLLVDGVARQCAAGVRRPVGGPWRQSGGG